jgi:hypothetical protein
MHGNFRWYVSCLLCILQATMLISPHNLAILVGDAQAWLPELVDRAKKLVVNGGFEEGTDLYVSRSYILIVDD